MPRTLRFASPPDAVAGVDTLILVGRADALRGAAVTELLPGSVQLVWDRMLESVSTGDFGAATTTWSDTDSPAKVTACVLPDLASHHNCAIRPDAITALVRKALGGSTRAGVVVVLGDAAEGLAAGTAAARAVPLYSGKGAGTEDEEATSVTVALLPLLGEVDLERIERVCAGVRLAGRLVDMPPSELSTDVFVAEARSVAADLGVTVRVFESEELRDGGFGGLWGVGKAATFGPKLVLLSHLPDGAKETIALVGKGIVYDTGGLSIKGKDHMPGMKIDMGGAAGMLGAFLTAVRGGFAQNLHCLLCLAENSVGPDATRPDDILHMYSGKTVEVNNTDAEGRLVLADGVAYASRHLAPDTIIDMATLTGAQLLATGKRHAAIVCNDAAFEQSAVLAGRASGDLTWPLPYCPELFRKEFRSEVADMKNSVKDRMNAQASCAAQFVAEHLDPEWSGVWMHIDMAGPVQSEDRGTGYGVALLSELLGF
jgi:probable aminopeptidase NPEPL1